MLLLDLIDNHGNTRSLWGYGVPRVMGSGVPSLLPIRKLFPHIPAAAFEALESKEVDVLIGLNMMEIQPAGGMGVDKVGGVTALRSLFGCGWVLGGHHPDIHSQSQLLSTSAVTMRCANLLVDPISSPKPAGHGLVDSNSSLKPAGHGLVDPNSSPKLAGHGLV